MNNPNQDLTTHDLPEQKCIECGELLCGATKLELGATDAPKPNDSLSICCECGAVMMFGSDLKLRALTADERTRIANDRAMMRHLRHLNRLRHFARAAVKAQNAVLN